MRSIAPSWHHLQTELVAVQVSSLQTFRYRTLMDLLCSGSPWNWQSQPHVQVRAIFRTSSTPIEPVSSCLCVASIKFLGSDIHLDTSSFYIYSPVTIFFVISTIKTFGFSLYQFSSSSKSSHSSKYPWDCIEFLLGLITNSESFMNSNMNGLRDVSIKQTVY